jgi:hypothetical protein
MSQESLENFDSQLSSTQQVPAEKLIPQSKVEELIVNAKHEAAEKARRQFMQQQQQSQQQQSYQEPQIQQAPSSFGGMSDVRGIVDEEIGRRLNELSSKAQRDQMEAQGNQLVEEFVGKIVNSPTYEENKAVFERIGPSLVNMSPVVYMANSMDNTADVMLELANNPTKISAIMQLTQIDPNLALQEMHKLSQSIKNNAAAKSMALANEPMNNMKSSPNSLDGGVKDVNYWKKIYR